MNIGRPPGPVLPPSPIGPLDSNPSTPPGANNAFTKASAASANTATSAATTQAQHVHHAHFKGVLFRQDGRNASMRRTQAPRTPVGKRGPGRARPAAGGAVEEGEVEQPEENIVPDEMRSLQVRIQSQDEQDGSQDESNQGRRDEKRLDRIALGKTVDEEKAADVVHVLRLKDKRFERVVQRQLAEDDDAPGITRIPAKKDARKIRFGKLQDSLPLPPMHSLDDVVRVIHAATQSDPAGESIGMLLKQINAAVMRREIKLPTLTLVSEARAALIGAFGTGDSNARPVSESLRSVHTLLPLWLINLSKRRTALERVQAAARLGLPMTMPSNARRPDSEAD